MVEFKLFGEKFKAKNLKELKEIMQEHIEENNLLFFTDEISEFTYELNDSQICEAYHEAKEQLPLFERV
jgi:hypothetical protein